MKNITYFPLLGFMTCTTACNKDNDEPKPEQPQYGIVSKIDVNIRYSDTEQYSMGLSVEYDTQNNITKISYSGDDDYPIFSYKREGNKLIVTEADVEHPNDIRSTCKANLDAKGQIITAEYSYDKNGNGKLEIQNIQCQYADNGDLTLCTNDYYETKSKFTWSNGNIVKNEYSSTDDGSSTYATGQQYSSTYENRTNFNFSDVLFGEGTSILSSDILSYIYLRNAGYLGNKDKYLPTKVAWTDVDQFQLITEYIYEFNDNGLPNTIVVKNNEGGVEITTVTMKITYKK